MRLIEFLTHYQEFAIFILLGKSLKNWTNKKIKNSQQLVLNGWFKTTGTPREYVLCGKCDCNYLHKICNVQLNRPQYYIC